jgi:succinoglycan biosynthesis protein ExoO
MQELVSVVMPAYNAEKYISEAIQSVLNQTYRNFELIIVDDGSTDKTWQIIQSYNDSRIIAIRHQQNKGVAEARNTALDIAKGKWVALIDADDAWLPERLEKLVGILEESGDGFFISDDHILCFDTPYGLRHWGSEFDIYYHINFDREIITFSFSDYLKHNAPGIHPIFPLRIIREKNLIQKQEFVPREDFLFYCELFKAGLELILTRNAYYMYRLTPESLTSKKPKVSEIKVVEHLLSYENLSNEEKSLLNNLLLRASGNFRYNTFTYYLKHREFHNAIKYGLQNPVLFLELVARLPLSLSYRISAKIRGGTIK